MNEDVKAIYEIYCKDQAAKDQACILNYYILKLLSQDLYAPPCFMMNE